MSSRLEGFLARLYVEAPLRERFLADRRETARAAGLDEADLGAIERLSAAELELAASSFAKKRAHAHPPASLWARLRTLIQR